jgi:copper homeostasis protein
MRIIRESCVETVLEIDNAAAGGADRIELCSNLEVGGLTPTADMVRYAAIEKKLNVAAMIRRDGSFYAGGQIDSLRDDIKSVTGAGASGLVFGFLTPDGCLDMDAIKALVTEARSDVSGGGKKELVFHMAFDSIPPRLQFDAIDTLAALGFSRILTKGGQGKAADNTARLKELNRRAQGKITILCGGGVTDDNYLKIAGLTGITEFHGRKLGVTGSLS